MLALLRGGSFFSTEKHDSETNGGDGGGGDDNDNDDGRYAQKSHQSIYFSMRLNIPIQLRNAMELNAVTWVQSLALVLLSLRSTCAWWTFAWFLRRKVVDLFSFDFFWPDGDHQRTEDALWQRSCPQQQWHHHHHRHLQPQLQPQQVPIFQEAGTSDA